jgi:DNA mismatch repair protein MSH3
VHCRPSELLLPASKLTNPSEKMLEHFIRCFSLLINHSFIYHIDTVYSESTGGHKARIERFAETMSYTEAYDSLTVFYSAKNGAHESSTPLETVTGFPHSVVIALAHAVTYLRSFAIADAFVQVRFFTRFATRAHMLLNANTLANLYAPIVSTCGPNARRS